MLNSDLSKIMHTAYVLRDNKPQFKFEDCLRQAWYFWYFRRALKNGYCRFSYFKGNPADFEGSRPIREAVGTLCEDLIPIEKRPKGEHPFNARATNYTACAYFDLEKGEWRSFRYVDFIGYVTFLELKEGFFVSQKRKEAKEKTMQFL